MLIFFWSCQDEKIKVSKLQQSIGERNELALVIEDSLWNGAIGDSVRKYLARPVEGLMKDEPMFTIIQYSPKIFNTKAKLSRNIVSFSIENDNKFQLEKSFYATPQNMFFVKSKSSIDLVNHLKKYSDSIVSVIKKSEVNEEQHYINRLLIHTDTLFKSLTGTTIKIPMFYQLAMYTEDPFFWYQKQLSSGDVNLVFYEFPIEYIERPGASVEEHLLQAKDSIGKHYIKGAKSYSYLMNNNTFTPMVSVSTFNDMQVYEIRGAWKMMNDIVYGPYLCYVFKDDYYKRYLFVEGFINDPNNPKRDHLLELEAIIQSINFYENPI